MKQEPGVEIYIFGGKVTDFYAERSHILDTQEAAMLGT